MIRDRNDDLGDHVSDSNDEENKESLNNTEKSRFRFNSRGERMPFIPPNLC